MHWKARETEMIVKCNFFGGLFSGSTNAVMLLRMHVAKNNLKSFYLWKTLSAWKLTIMLLMILTGWIKFFWRGICGVNRIITLSGKIVDDFWMEFLMTTFERGREPNISVWRASNKQQTLCVFLSVSYSNPNFQRTWNQQWGPGFARSIQINITVLIVRLTYCFYEVIL